MSEAPGTETMMSGRLSPTLTYRAIPGLPAKHWRPGPRDSYSRDLVEAAAQSPSKAVVVEVEDPDESMRFYKSVIQWITRNRDLYPGARVRKRSSTFYVWIEEEQEAEHRR